MKTATLLLRPDSVHYRYDAFERGLRACGYDVGQRQPTDLTPDDLLVIWNRQPGHWAFANRYEAAGAKVLVAENGYIGVDPQGRQLFALALNHHNGAGRWMPKDPPEDRWERLGVELKPWREAGSRIIIFPQRSIGEPGVRMEADWPTKIVPALRSRRPVVVHDHPGKVRPPLGPVLDGAWAAVVWGSGAGIKALALGIPVFYEFEQWIGAPAAKLLSGSDPLRFPFLGDRLPMFQRLAWAQWTAEEIASGLPFRVLLQGLYGDLE